MILPNIQNQAVCWAKCAQCMCVHMMVFLPAENTQTAFKMLKQRGNSSHTHKWRSAARRWRFWCLCRIV